MHRFKTTHSFRTGLPAAPLFCALLVVLAIPAFAAKDPQVIRQHLLEHPDRSVTAVSSIEPHQGEALDELLETRIWKVAYESEASDGESLVFMAVDEGEALRIHRFDQPRSRENFVRLLPDDLRVRSREDAAKLVAATLDLYFGFPFGEPELTVEEMRFERQGNDFYFIDGERFGDATGYRISTDDEGRVIAYEYSWELPVAPLED
jgi:hypothetical protein